MKAINEIHALVEDHLHDDLSRAPYKIRTIKARDLLTSNRLDVAFKLLYLEMLSYNVDFSVELYKEHIRAFSLGEFSEPGNDSKNTIEHFIQDFSDIFQSFKEGGFDSSKSVIPVSKQGSIVNGSHRLASAIYLDQNVKCIELETDSCDYGYDFFYKRGVTSNFLDTIVTKFIEYSSNTYVAVVWPTAVGKDSEISDLIPNVICQKRITLNSNGAANFLAQVYSGEAWLGDEENNFKGAQGKLIECFKSFDDVRVFAFQASDLNEVLAIKNKIRDIFNVGKHSVHITDTHEEAVKIARTVFNENSIHFLNNAHPNKYLNAHKKIEKFKENIKNNSCDNNHFLIDSSLILSLYGLRDAHDTDFLTSYNIDDLKLSDESINYHDEELIYYETKKNELIYNQINYFYFKGLKFVSFDVLYKMKRNRSEQKDINDCKMMDAYMSNDYFILIKNKISQNLLYQKVKFKVKLIFVLKKIGLHKIVKKIFVKLFQ